MSRMVNRIIMYDDKNKNLKREEKQRFLPLMCSALWKKCDFQKKKSASQNIPHSESTTSHKACAPKKCESEGVGSFWFADGTKSQQKEMNDLPNKAWRRYLQALQTHPLRTKAITAGCLAGCSDTVAQKIAGAKQLQLKRIGLIFLYGLLYAGPFGHFLHKLMDQIFKGRRDTQTIVKKVALEQLFTGPWNNFFFMVYFGLIVEGRPWSLVRSKIKKDYPTVQLNSWKIWPLIGWINYRYMPLQLRVLFHGFVASCWGVFLSLKARSLTIKAA